MGEGGRERRLSLGGGPLCPAGPTSHAQSEADASPLSLLGVWQCAPASHRALTAGLLGQPSWTLSAQHGGAALGSPDSPPGASPRGVLVRLPALSFWLF